METIDYQDKAMEDFYRLPPSIFKEKYPDKILVKLIKDNKFANYFGTKLDIEKTFSIKLSEEEISEQEVTRDIVDILAEMEIDWKEEN